MSTPLRVLNVEDLEEDSELLRLDLRRGGYDPTIQRVDTADAMLAALSGGMWDVVVADYHLPRFSALSALALLKRQGLDIPFIVVSGRVGEDTAVEAMKAGAHDYILKDNLARLVPAIQRELRDAEVRREHKQMEEQIGRAQRLELAGRIAGQVAHDFNNLLSPLVGYPQLIKKQLPTDHPAVGFCDTMIRVARQMAAINDDLLTLARRGHIDREITDANLVLDQVMAQMPDRPSTLAVRTELAPELLPIKGSSAQLMRVFSNLLANAREAMHDEGTLTVRTTNFYADRPLGHFNNVARGEYVRIEVSDTGCGIDAEIRDRIFDPFFTTKRTDKQRGSGLGLSVVQAIVEDHQGCVDVASEIGKGATFNVYLPVCREAASTVVADDTRGGSETILVVDDDQDQLELDRQLLEPLGYRVATVMSGEEALDYLRERRTNLVILDMIMPEGIDGAETYRRALEERPGQRAIIVSGFAESDRVREARALGAGTFLRKPVTLESLARAVREELDRVPEPELVLA